MTKLNYERARSLDRANRPAPPRRVVGLSEKHARFIRNYSRYCREQKALGQEPLDKDAWIAFLRQRAATRDKRPQIHAAAANPKDAIASR